MSRLVVIGGTSGIGSYIVSFFSDKGVNVIYGGRNRRDKVCQNACYLPIDVTDEESVRTFFARPELFSFDSLVYSAGVTTRRNDLLDFDPKDYKRVNDVNVLGLLLVLKYSQRALFQAKGRVVVISSLAARDYSRFSGVEYSISKAAVGAVVRQIALEWATQGVLINSVLPGMVESEMLFNQVDKTTLDEVEGRIPLRCLAKPRDVALAAEFLLSSENRYLTGVGIDVNGGQYLTA